MSEWNVLKHPMESTSASSSVSTFRPSSNPASEDSQRSKSSQMTKQFYSKFSQVIVASRMFDPTSPVKYPRKINKWFNIETFEYSFLKEELKFWKLKAVDDPQPLFLDIYLDISKLSATESSRDQYTGDTALLLRDQVTGQYRRIPEETLHYKEQSLDGNFKYKRKTSILMESWKLSSTFDPMLHPLNQTSLAQMYKQSVIFFRSLYSLLELMPLSIVKSQILSNSIKIKYRLSTVRVKPVHELEFTQCHFYTPANTPTSELQFTPVSHPYGTFSACVLFRKACEFQVQPLHQNIPRQINSALSHGYKPNIRRSSSSFISSKTSESFQTSNLVQIPVPSSHRTTSTFSASPFSFPTSGSLTDRSNYAQENLETSDRSTNLSIGHVNVKSVQVQSSQSHQSQPIALNRLNEPSIRPVLPMYDSPPEFMKNAKNSSELDVGNEVDSAKMQGNAPFLISSSNSAKGLKVAEDETSLLEFIDTIDADIHASINESTMLKDSNTLQNRVSKFKQMLDDHSWQDQNLHDVYLKQPQTLNSSVICKPRPHSVNQHHAMSVPTQSSIQNHSLDYQDAIMFNSDSDLNKKEVLDDELMFDLGL